MEIPETPRCIEELDLIKRQAEVLHLTGEQVGGLGLDMDIGLSS